MNYHVIATLVGITLQFLGADYLVCQAQSTAIKLAKYNSNITYDSFSMAIDHSTQEITGQFKQQLRGFF